MWLNRTVAALADTLTESWQVLHLTGLGKGEAGARPEGYVAEPLLTHGMDDVYALADAVVCRAGLGTLSELAAVGKPAIVIPLPASHQEMNAFHLFEHHAAIVLDQNDTTPQVLLTAIRSVLESEDVPLRLSANLKLSFPQDGTARIADGVLALARTHDASWKTASTEEKTVVEVPAVEVPDMPSPSPSREQEALFSLQEQIAQALESGRREDTPKQD